MKSTIVAAVRPTMIAADAVQFMVVDPDGRPLSPCTFDDEATALEHRRTLLKQASPALREAGRVRVAKVFFTLLPQTTCHKCGRDPDALENEGRQLYSCEKCSNDVCSECTIAAEDNSHTLTCLPCLGLR